MRGDGDEYDQNTYKILKELKKLLKKEYPLRRG